MLVSLLLRLHVIYHVLNDQTETFWTVCCRFFVRSFNWPCSDPERFHWKCKYLRELFINVLVQSSSAPPLLQQFQIKTCFWEVECLIFPVCRRVVFIGCDVVAKPKIEHDLLVNRGRTKTSLELRAP